MKKLIFTLAIVFSIATSVSAQNPGKVWLGGSVGISTSKTGDSESTTSYKIIPEIGYVVSENWGVGIKIGYGHNQNVGWVSGSYDGTPYQTFAKDAFFVNPFVRYSFLKGDIGGLFIDTGIGYTYLKDDYAEYSNSSWEFINRTINIFEVGFRPGVSLNISDKVALTSKFGFLGYQHIKYGNTKTNSFGFDLNMENILLGMNFVF